VGRLCVSLGPGVDRISFAAGLHVVCIRQQ
jgi:hypothetical protein